MDPTGEFVGSVSLLRVYSGFTLGLLWVYIGLQWVYCWFECPNCFFPVIYGMRMDSTGECVRSVGLLWVYSRFTWGL